MFLLVRNRPIDSLSLLRLTRLLRLYRRVIKDKLTLARTISATKRHRCTCVCVCSCVILSRNRGRSRGRSRGKSSGISSGGSRGRSSGRSSAMVFPWWYKSNIHFRPSTAEKQIFLEIYKQIWYYFLLLFPLPSLISFHPRAPDLSRVPP
jgi:hypothetical protein